MPDANVTINISGNSDDGINGLGEEGAPYVISKEADWNILASYVNSGKEGYASAYYELGADNITVTTMMGNNTHRFKGHFDDNGKTLTVNYDTNEDYTTPFRYVEGADIHDLKVAGTIKTLNKFAAGIVGFATGNNSIKNCRVSVTITSNVIGDGTHGGFVANVQDNTTTFTNCAFNGSMTGSSTSNCCGFVGWTEGNNGGAVNINNCLFAPSSLTVGTIGSATFSRGHYRDEENEKNITINDCYYTSSLGTVQGTKAYAEDPADIPVEQKAIAGVNYYVPKTIVSDITATNITATSADISWKGVEGCTYKVRYSKEATKYFCGFEEGMGEWTKIDADGDGYNWEYVNNPEGQVAHTGSAAVFSESYRSMVGPLKPDNWLISPQLTLGGKLKVCLKGQASNDYKEIFAIYLSTTGNSVEDFTITLVPETEATSKYQEYTADLSNYKGQQGYIAIRHFNCTDLLVLDLDDFGIYDVWTETTVNANSYTITDLNLGTEYEVEVQAAM